MTKGKAEAMQPDFERVKAAMKMVAAHKCKGNLINTVYPKDWDILAEAAVRTMWLIEAEMRL